MSSAILYAAIVAIWACVLIPRWLKRDSARSAAAQAAAAQAAAAAEATAAAEAAQLDDATPSDGSMTADDATRDDEPPAVEGGTSPGPALVSPLESRRRVLKARRRLLWMLGGLTVAAYALAGTALAAWWVTVPPTVMLAGYLLLLREAGRADAEASRREHEALEARQAARARGRARHARARASAATVAPAVPVTYAAAPVAADYDDEGPGRDFTLDRRYAASSSATASPPALAVDEDDDTDEEYTENRLRAVGD
jgi:hypothetical protein